MHRLKIKLNSLYYTEKKFQDLVQILTCNSDDPQIRIEAYDKNGVREFEDVDSLFNNRFIPQRVSKFELTVITDSGTGKVSANNGFDRHILYLNGEDKWVSEKKDSVKAFTRRNEYSKIRSIFDWRGRLCLVGAAIGVLLTTQVRHLLPYFGIPMYTPYTTHDLASLLFSLTLILTAVFLGKLYPFVQIQTSSINRTPTLERVRKTILVISAVVGLITGTIQLIGYL